MLPISTRNGTTLLCSRVCDMMRREVMLLLQGLDTNWTSHTVSFLTVGGFRLTRTRRFVQKLY